MDLLSDSAEFGRRLAAARGYKGELRPTFAKRIGTSDTTLLKWEKGEFSSNFRTVEQRMQLAERTVLASGCPPEWFGLEEVSDEEGLGVRLRKQFEDLSGQVAIQDGDLSDLRREVADLRAQVEALIGERLEDSEVEDLPDDASSSSSEERGPGEANA